MLVSVFDIAISKLIAISDKTRCFLGFVPSDTFTPPVLESHVDGDSRSPGGDTTMPGHVGGEGRSPGGDTTMI